MRGKMSGLLDGLRGGDSSPEMKSTAKLLKKSKTTSDGEGVSITRPRTDTLGGKPLDISATSRNTALRAEALELDFQSLPSPPRASPLAPSLPSIRSSPLLASLLVTVPLMPTILPSPRAAPKTREAPAAHLMTTRLSPHPRSRFQSRPVDSTSLDTNKGSRTAGSNNLSPASTPISTVRSASAPAPAPAPAPASASTRRRNEYTSTFATVPDDPPAPTTMYWSRTPFGGRPFKGIRAHSTTLVGSDIWLFGGCDLRGICSNQVWKYDTDTYHWIKPKCFGDLPPPTRAHSSTVYDKRLFIFGGGTQAQYYDTTYLLDTLSYTWSKPAILGRPPASRRAHAAIIYKQQIIIFGGGNGSMALSDLHSLDVSDLDELKWSGELETTGKRPIGRGYHSFNLVGSKAVLVGGSDGIQCFSDVHILDLEKLVWTEVNFDPEISLNFPRLSHTTTVLGPYLFIIGGHDGISFSSEILCFNLVSLQWESHKTAGQPPSPRGYHSTIHHDSRLFIIGGFNGSVVFDEMFTLDLAGSAFLPQITNFKIEIPEVES